MPLRRQRVANRRCEGQSCREAVEEQDRRTEKKQEESQRPHDPKRRGLAALERQALRRQFAEDDVQLRNDDEAYAQPGMEIAAKHDQWAGNAPALPHVDMAVAVMQVGVMRMGVGQWFVTVPMRMRLAKGIVRPMSVLVMRVMHVTVLMLRRFVRMFMHMDFREMQINADSHQQSGCNEAQR